MAQSFPLHALGVVARAEAVEAFPERAAVMVVAAKSPLPSRSTTVPAVFAAVALAMATAAEWTELAVEPPTVLTVLEVDPVVLPVAETSPVRMSMACGLYAPHAGGEKARLRMRRRVFFMAIESSNSSGQK
jgi:hypothetical protein